MADRVNQQLIADKLKISRATVSRCFTNHPGINPGTRSRVFELAAALGYRHMETRTGVRREKSKLRSFGLLVATDGAEYQETTEETPAAKLIAGVSEFSVLHGVDMELHFVAPGDDGLEGDSFRQIEALQSRLWDGVILIYPFHRAVIDELNLLLPVVSLVQQYSSDSINCVDADHYRGISKIVRTLVDQGHQRIGFLTHAYETESLWAMRRHAAFVQEMTRHGLPIDPADILNVRPELRRSVEETHMTALERTRFGVTAWVCAADHQAYSLVDFFTKRGLHVPDEVSITGFDGLTPPRGAPELTTALIPYHEIGLTGGQRLSDLVRKRFTTTQSILLDCSIHHGSTVKPINSTKPSCKIA